MATKLLDLTTLKLKKESEQGLARIKNRIETILSNGGLKPQDRQKYYDILSVITAIGHERIAFLNKKNKKHRKGHRF